MGTPLFAVFDDISPVVTVRDNFDSLLFPDDHVGRQLSDSYYVNKGEMLRAHTTAHQLFNRVKYTNSLSSDLEIFEKQNSSRSIDRQESHTLDAAKLLEYDLKKTLTDLTKSLFGPDIEYRWVTEDVFFPFTHPSWELEIWYEGEWMEVLGAGVIEQKILNNAGVGHKVGWAFGLGLERLAMRLFSIPDIRLFWSEDIDFLRQFVTNDVNSNIKYKPISQYPACVNDLSFWIDPGTPFECNDFYDLVRSVAGDIVQQVKLVDEYKKGDQMSHCYRITYRHMEKTFTQEEVNEIHDKVAIAAMEQLNVKLR